MPLQPEGLRKSIPPFSQRQARGQACPFIKARGERNTKNIDAVTTKSALSLLNDLDSSSRYIRWKCDSGLSAFQGAENDMMNGLNSSSFKTPSDYRSARPCSVFFPMHPTHPHASDE